ncbi:MAG: hypothetical protein KTR21_14755 [Rhodobacteraceae bacterium]|nr:hypothetical protein [Paracoccaceae bacterium]
MRRPHILAILTMATALGGAVAVPNMAARAETPAQTEDPRANDPQHRRAQKMFGAIREILDEAARLRAQREANGSALEEFLWRQVGVDQEARVRELLDSAFGMMTDTDVTAIQKDIARRKKQIEELRDGVSELREQRIAAPEDGGWDSWVGAAQDKADIDASIADIEERIVAQQRAIDAAKGEFSEAIAAAGAELSPDQVDMLLESVTGSDLVAMAAAYDAVRGVSEQLRELMDQNGEDLAYAKRYYGMHTALIALLLEAQRNFLGKIDGDYLPKLAAIERDINAASRETDRLLKDDPTRAQRRALSANRDAQLVAKEALTFYREVLMRQRAEIEAAFKRTAKELRVADNTLRTVDASFQLRQLMESAANNFETLESLETPGFDRVFRNERLRKEFQDLTDQLEPSS